MDELLIDEKKYLSTKRAAKVTGYAKDYIGQLCREGRVKARQVGRSWYVLESDIRQHRFGSAEAGPPSVSIPVAEEKSEVKPKSADKVDKPIDHTWEAPKYAPVYDAPPQINLLKKEQHDTAEESKGELKKAENPSVSVKELSQGDSEPLDNLNEAWEAWFSNNNGAEPAQSSSEVAAHAAGNSHSEPQEDPESATEADFKPVASSFGAENAPEASELVEESVPIIRRTEVPAYSTKEKPRIEMFQPQEAKQEKTVSVASSKSIRSSAWVHVVRFVSVVCALGAVGLVYLQIGHNKALISKLPSSISRISGSTTFENTK